MKRGPLKVFYSYAHEDEAVRDRIDEHLKLLARQNLIVGWHDRRLLPGAEWNQVIGEMLTSADIVLLLVSRAFMASRYIHEVEIPEAMKAQASGQVRVVPIMIEKMPGWTKAAFAKLQILPSRSRCIKDWDDPVEAYQDIARGIAQVVKDVIIAGGGPFEFGAHEFTEAELAALPRLTRQRTAAGLERLRADLNQGIPPRKYESNLLVATWALREFGDRRYGRPDEPEALFYMAQVISSFDLVALQDIERDSWRLEALMEILGPDWNVLLTDVVAVSIKPERFAILYYRPRVEFRNLASQVVAPPVRRGGGTPEQQFMRPPLVAAFRSGAWDFQVCTAHLIFGSYDQRGMQARLEEVHMLGQYLKFRTRYEQKDLLLLGQFQMGERQSPILEALRERNVQIPDELLHPTNFLKNKYYDLIGFSSEQRAMPLGASNPRSGAFDIFQHVLRAGDLDTYRKTASFRALMTRERQAGPTSQSQLESRYRLWRTYVISDHLPLWAELTLEAKSESESRGSPRVRRSRPSGPRIPKAGITILPAK